jgi:hypothetical protein
VAVADRWVCRASGAEMPGNAAYGSAGPDDHAAQSSAGYATAGAYERRTGASSGGREYVATYIDYRLEWARTEHAGSCREWAARRLAAARSPAEQSVLQRIFTVASGLESAALDASREFAAGVARLHADVDAGEAPHTAALAAVTATVESVGPPPLAQLAELERRIEAVRFCDVLVRELTRSRPARRRRARRIPIAARRRRRSSTGSSASRGDPPKEDGEPHPPFAVAAGGGWFQR